MGLDGIDDATARAMTARNELLLAPSMTGACMHYGRDLY
jgi:hypothetical protein